MDEKNANVNEIAELGMKAANAYLQARGCDVLERGWTCEAGEADVIAMDGEDLVFVAVKTRSGISKGFAPEALTPASRERIERIAACYLNEHDTPSLPVRFDVMGILIVGPDRCFIKHHVNAFGTA